MKRKLLMLFAFITVVIAVKAQTTCNTFTETTVFYPKDYTLTATSNWYYCKTATINAGKSAYTGTDLDPDVPEVTSKIGMLQVKTSGDRAITFNVKGIVGVTAGGYGDASRGFSISAVPGANGPSSCPDAVSKTTTANGVIGSLLYPASGELDPTKEYLITVRAAGSDSFLYFVKFIVSSGPSTDTTLSSLTVNENEATKIEDDELEYDYKYELLYTYNESTFSVAAVTTNSGASAVISPNDVVATPAAGLYTDVQVNVTPASGDSDAKTHVLRVFKQASLSSDASLGMLKVNNTSVTLVDGKLIYDIELPITYAEATATVEIEANDENASVQPDLSQIVSVPGNVTFTITPQSGVTDAKTYIINVAKATYHTITDGETFETSEGNILSTGWAVYASASYSLRSNLGSGNYPNLSKADRVVDLYVSECGSITIKAEGNTSNNRVLTVTFDDGEITKTAFWPGGVTEQTFNVPTTGECKISIGGLDNNSVYLGGVTFHTSAIEIPKINENDAFYSILKADQLINAENLVLSGDWKESYFNTLKLALGANSLLASIDMSNVTIPASDFLSGITNTNCLKYVAQDAGVPSSWTSNVIKGSTAENIVLTDGKAFNNTKEFTAKNISYVRDFTVMAGWASLCLPFAAEVEEGDLVEEFSACDGTKATFTVVEDAALTPNKPYIIKIAEEVGSKTFKASDVKVDPTAIENVCKGEYTFKGNYNEIPVGSVTENMYLLQTSGVAFAKGTANSYIPAFRAYIEYTPTGEPSGVRQLAIGHGDNGTTGLSMQEASTGLKIWSGNGVIEIISDKAQVIRLYSLDGRLVRNIDLTEGNNTVSGLAKGVYLVNNQKVVVR